MALNDYTREKPIDSNGIYLIYDSFGLWQIGYWNKVQFIDRAGNMLDCKYWRQLPDAIGV